MLTPVQYQQITKFFSEHPLRPCQVCGIASGFHIMDVGFMPDMAPTSRVVNTPTTLMVLLHCGNCMNVLMFYAAGMGVR